MTVKRRRHTKRGKDGRIVAKGIITLQGRAADFWARVEKGNKCWIWIGKTNPRHGYGQFYVGWNGERYLEIRAHRGAWELSRGPIPEGAHVLHTCDNPICVNPDHLVVGSHADNMKDAARKRRLRWQKGCDMLDKIESGHFTREDVEVLRMVAPHFAFQSVVFAGKERGWMGLILADLASRIEALLPPEDQG